MKKLLFVFALAIVTASTGLLAQPPHAGMYHSAPANAPIAEEREIETSGEVPIEAEDDDDDAVRPHDVLRQLPNLTPEQEDKVREIHRRLQRQMLQHRAEIRARKAELDRLVLADNPDINAVNQKADEIGMVKARMMRSKMAAHIEIRQILTEQQRLEFDAMHQAHHSIRKEIRQFNMQGGGCMCGGMQGYSKRGGCMMQGACNGGGKCGNGGNSCAGKMCSAPCQQKCAKNGGACAPKSCDKPCGSENACGDDDSKCCKKKKRCCKKKKCKKKSDCCSASNE